MYNIDLKEIERRAFRSTFQDGIWDIYLGLLLLLFGIALSLLEFGIVIEWIGVIVITLCLLCMGFFIAGKKYITVPRIGRVTFSAARRSKTKNMTLLLTISFIIGVVLLAIRLVGNEDLFGWIAPVPFPALLFSAVCLVTFSSGAFLLDNIRFHLYGLFYAFPFPIVVILKSHTDMIGLWLLAYGIPSVLMLIVGVVLFYRFLRDYPPLTKEVLHDSVH
ncbi:MAG: hypothetical protein JSU77_07610 [Fidelibacterota bacterium]|nr:MAG: hypothetical protein JSU77_07610 [Candidatus Neomarinimicrobiota bacterium]